MLGAILSIIITMGTVTTDTTVEAQVQAEYPNKEIEIVETYNLSYEELTTRDGKVIVEHVEVTADGNGGSVDADGWYIGLEEDHQKGEKVDAYLVYNPNTNAEDDIVKVIEE